MNLTNGLYQPRYIERVQKYPVWISPARCIQRDMSCWIFPAGYLKPGTNTVWSGYLVGSGPVNFKVP